jgi:hypothetical protein
VASHHHLRQAQSRTPRTTEKGLRERCRLSFVKVVEYQRRGVVHLHVLARLDPSEGRELPPELDAQALAASLAQAARQVAVAFPEPIDGTARFGVQMDLQRLPQGVDEEAPVAGVAGYLANYATKSSDDSGALDRRVRSASDLARRELPDHLRRLAETAWRLGGRWNLQHLGLRRFAHALGFRGHWLTKSRAWSVTFSFLRAERAAWRAAGDEGDDRVDDVVVLRSWSFEARGWASDGEALLAARRQADGAQARRDRWLEGGRASGDGTMGVAS